MRVLLVEDDAALRRAFARVLKGAGHQVTPVESAAEAAGVIATVRIEVVLTDLCLGDDFRGGLRVVTICQDAGIPVVLMSGDYSGLADGELPPVWVDKPVTPDVLAEALARAVGW
jgi:DNA-binding NtrC family response regulator